jgi:cytochrome c peroxidase
MSQLPPRAARAAAPGVALAFTLLLAGCQKAAPYNPRAKGTAEASEKGSQGAAPAKPEPLPAAYVWERSSGTRKEVRIEFVHQGTQPEEWARLEGFWNDSLPARAATAVGLSGLAAAPLAAAAGRQAIEIKVPLGLDDPLSYIPAANPPTLAKWELGRRLFFDDKWLTAKGGESCATCHIPGQGYTDGKREVKGGRGPNTPTLINCVYNSHQFWDGRVPYLEGVVQAHLEDERETESRQFRHAWGGVIERLRDDKSSSDQFEAVFGTQPTQVAVGRALATYLRTVLAGNSLHDRAVAAAKGRPLEEGLYAAALDEAALEELGRAGGVKAVVASELFRGYSLFRGKAACAGCHTPSNGFFADNGFHNIGVGLEDYTWDNAKRRPGRFGVAPLGEKNRYLIGAYKTPTLRSLLRTGPYFHNGSERDLLEVVRFHVRKKSDTRANPYLDPRLADRDGEHRDFGLSDAEMKALVLFLQALNGEDVAAFVKAKPPASKRPNPRSPP